MKHTLVRLLVLGLGCALLIACEDSTVEQRQPPTIDECEGLPALTLGANPPNLRIHGASTLRAAGGSGRYTYALTPDGSGGELRVDRLVAGPTPAADTVTVSDDCGNSASLEIPVAASFSVLPARARIRPGVRFQIAAEGNLGEVIYSGESLGSGGSVSPDGVYTAGPAEGVDLVVATDTGSGEEALLQYRVDKSARFRGAPERLGLPAGASVELATSDGSGVREFRVVEGPGVVVDGVFSAGREASGKARVQASDSFTHELAAIEITILTELTRESRPHGRLTDQGALVTGDFDGDQIADVALGVPESDLGKPTGGAVFVFKGSEAGLPTEPTWIITGEYDTAKLGSVLAAGDLNGDGRDDLAISEPGADVTTSDSGAVLLYKFSEQGPELLRPALTGLGRGNFGASLTIADADGDGDADLVVGSPGGDLAASSSVNSRGVVDVFLLTNAGSIPDLGAVRVGGVDLGGDGNVRSAGGLRFGRDVAVADFNDDGRPDLASLGSVNNSQVDGNTQAKSQIAVAVHLGRAASPIFADSPDLYLLPANPGDEGEGNWRLLVAPAVGGSAPRLLLTADQLDSPDLTAQGGVKSGSNSGGAYLFDLSGTVAPDATLPHPTQLGRNDAFARIWGDASGISAGRSATFADLEQNGSLSLILGAPNSTHVSKVDGKDVSRSRAGKLLVFPYSELSAGAQLNKPSDSLPGALANDALGVAAATWRPGASAGLLAFAARASTEAGDFTGRLDAYLGKGALASFAVSQAALPARVASQQHGVAIELFSAGGRLQALLGAPGYSGNGAKNDGNELAAGQALLYRLDQPTSPSVVREGAGSPYLSNGQLALGGRGLGADVALTDFNGDGRLDLVVGAPQLATPTASSSDYALLRPECVTASAQGNGGALIHLAQADGSFKEGFRVFAASEIAGCTPTDSDACKRRNLSRAGLAGGFDFDGDGLDDLLLTRTNGLELFLGRAPDDEALGKPSMACEPALSLPALAQDTSAPFALPDLDGDGCDEVGARYADDKRSGVLLVFGFDAAGTRCAGHNQAAWLRISGDPEVGLNNMRLGVASSYAGAFLADERKFIAVSAALYPFEGVQQPTVLLFDAAQLAAQKPAAGEQLVGALHDGLTPLALTYRERAPGLGRAVLGNADLNGDGTVDLLVSAPGMSLNGDGAGAVFVLLGGPASTGKLDSWLTVLGDGAERASLGQDLSIAQAAGGAPLTLGIGAPLSYRTGTANGTAWLLPLR